MTFSYDRVWQDVTAMLKANVGVLVSLGGAFLFLPSFALLLFAPMPQGQAETGTAALDALIGYYRHNIVGFVIANIVSTFGQATVLVMLIDRSRPTVADALGIAARLFPAYLVVSLLTSFAMGAGFALLIVPGVYLLGRLAVAGPVVVDGHRGDPFSAMTAAWRATDHLGWRLAGLALLIGVVAWIGFSAATSIVTVGASFMLPSTTLPAINAFANAVGGAALAMLMAVLSVAIYRELGSNKGT